MRLIIESLAKQCLDDIFYYNLQYSQKNAVETNKGIQTYINDLVDFPYIGINIAEIKDKHFREIIYRKSRFSSYRIIYYISEVSNTIYVLNVINSRQDFNQFLKLNNYFKNYFRF